MSETYLRNETDCELLNYNQQSPSSCVSLSSVDAAFTSLSNFYSGGGRESAVSVESSCDLVSSLRHLAPPATHVVQYGRGGEAPGLESAIREQLVLQ